MANIRVKDLPNTNTAADTDEFIIDSSTAGTRRLSYSELKSEISTDFAADVSAYGIATLDSDNKLTASQIPDSLAQGMNFVGVANSAGDLTSTTQGDFYVIQTAFGSYNVGDQAVYDGSAYVRVVDGTKEISEGGTGATTLDAAKTNLEIIDVGTAPNQVPLNSMLSGMAYMSPDSVSVAELEVTDNLEVIPPGTNLNPGIVSKVGAFLSSHSEVGLGFSGFPSGDGASKSAIIHERKDTYGRGDLHICSNYDADATNANKSDAVITVDGSTESVGIGTSSPSSKLTVDSGDIQLQASSGANVDSQSINWKNTNSSGFDIAKVQAATGGNIYEGQLKFLTKDSGGTMAERLRIDSSGRVGIANSSPSSFHSSADDLVVGQTSSATHSGITVANASGGTGSVFFAKGTSGDELYRGQIQYAHGSDTMYFGTAGASAWSINSSQNLVAVGSGVGIDFGSAASGSGTPITNGGLLDDYEAGTFTPVVADAASGGNVGTTAARSGAYTKVGRIVHFSLSLTNIDTTGMTAGNNLYIRGLPFVAISGDPQAQLAVKTDRVSFDDGIVGTALYNTSTAYLTSIRSGLSDLVVPVSNYVTGVADVYLSGSYIAA